MCKIYFAALNKFFEARLINKNKTISCSQLFNVDYGLNKFIRTIEFNRKIQIKLEHCEILNCKYFEIFIKYVIRAMLKNCKFSI